MSETRMIRPMPGMLQRYSTAPPAPRHGRDAEPRAARRLLAVVTMAAIGLALSYPRGAGMTLLEWLTWATGGLVLGLVLVRTPQRPLVPWPALVIVAWFAASALWSQDAGATLDATLLYLWFTALGILACWLSEPDDLPLALCAAMVLIVALSTGATIFEFAGSGDWEPWSFVGADRSFQGLYGNRNILAYSVVLLVPAALTLRVRSIAGTVALRVLALSVAVTTLAFTRSSTGLLTGTALVAGTVGVWALRRALTARSRSARWRVLAPLVLVVVAAGLVAVKSLSRRDLTLSGRTPLWASIIESSRDSAVLGNGWGAVWNYHWMPAPKNSVRSAINEALGAPLAHGHNAVFDLLPQVGYVGVGLVIAMQAWTLIRLVRAARSEARTWGLLTLLAINLVGITEPTWTIPLGWILLIMVAATAGRLPRETRTRRPAQDTPGTAR